MKKILSLIVFMAAVLVASSQEAPEGLFIASKAPNFKAKDQYGQEIQLKELLKKGKVVLVFYRGQWCPFATGSCQGCRIHCNSSKTVAPRWLLYHPKSLKA